MTKERLLERQEQLRLQMEQARQQFHALSGALADVEFWLSELITAPSKSKKE